MPCQAPGLSHTPHYVVQASSPFTCFRRQPDLSLPSTAVFHGPLLPHVLTHAIPNSPSLSFGLLFSPRKFLEPPSLLILLPLRLAQRGFASFKPTCAPQVLGPEHLWMNMCCLGLNAPQRESVPSSLSPAILVLTGMKTWRLKSAFPTLPHVDVGACH